MSATCPTCGAAASGKFCSSCGATLAGADCRGCAAPLSAGAKFCHRCGLPTSGARPPEARGIQAALPWAVAAIALVALVALVAGQRVGANRPADAATAGAAGGFGQTGRAPDISNLSPQERAERLFDRVMALAERGRPDSVQIFAPMAIAAYEMLGRLNDDQRYDLGRIAEVSGDEEIARAQADTILRENPNHLLGLILASRAARMRGDPAGARDYLRRFVAAEPTERRKQLTEYQLHDADIRSALAEAGAIGR